ncbi:MAG: ATP-binding cassette domain-containing protein [Anaerolineaceae bacterium]|nr:ATP-binding cassette domain-containing protein [Anaerolineaceae bacterium]
MSDAIQVQNVYKQYNSIGTLRLKTIAQDMTRILRRAPEMAKSNIPAEPRYVLNNIDFNLEQGKSLGLIGHNGSGKTTLLRLLAGVSLPTRGRVRVVGKVAPLLALGAGFHPDLTGHENLFLNCTLMGLSRKQSLDRIEQIITFADIGDYIESPIKLYSSGMLARLGFAAAIHMDPEVILLDEVLSVGDYIFGIKANTAIREFVGKGTLVFVSHDLNSVEKLCERVIWMDRGCVREDGAASDVIASYMKDQQRELHLSYGLKEQTETDSGNVAADKRMIDPRVEIRSVSVHGSDGVPKSQFEFGETIILRCHIHLNKPVADLRVVMGITDINSRAVITACDNQQLDPLGLKEGDFVLEAVFPAAYIRPRGLGILVTTSNPVDLLELASWKDIGPRFFTIGARRDAEHHYYAPQSDLVYTPHVEMRVVDRD